MIRRSATWLLFALVLFGAGCSGDSDKSAAEAAAQQDPSNNQLRPRELPPVAALAEAVESDPDDFKTRHLLALALHRENRREEALEQFVKVAEQSAETVYKIELGVAYASLQRMDDAEATFQRALEGDPGNPLVLRHLGNFAQRRGETAEAISLYRQAIENDPQHLMAHFQLGESLRRSGQVKDAYRSYEQVVSLDPQTRPEAKAFDASLLQLATLDLQMGATERALEFLRILTEAVPDHPSAHLLMGEALGRLGQEDDARAELAIHQGLLAQRGGTPPDAPTP